MSSSEIVSIHAPARGATLKGQRFIGWHTCFNPRTRTGCDYNPPTRPRHPNVFQSTHPHGVRQGGLKMKRVYWVFQSTHPHGVRLAGIEIIKRPTKRFNPRTRTGCDVLLDGIHRWSPLVSIHAPARGATRSPLRKSLLFTSFNPRTRTGCDLEEEETK